VKNANKVRLGRSVTNEAFDVSTKPNNLAQKAGPFES